MAKQQTNQVPENKVPAPVDIECDVDIVRELTKAGHTAGYIARKLQMDVDEFVQKYETVMDDALEEVGAEMILIAKQQARDKNSQGDGRTALAVFDKFRNNPKDYRVIGAKNSSRPIVIRHDDAGSLPAPAISEAILVAIEQDNKQAA